jgi:esterase/lipase superfamily enzyme
MAVALSGCATTYPMMPTPVLYAGLQAKPLFTSVPAERRTPPLDLLFITDRAPATSAEADLPYTADRSRSLAFGSTIIQFGEGVNWDTLVKQSSVSERTVPVELTLGRTKEFGRYPPIPYEIAVTAGGLSRSAAVSNRIGA